MKFQIGFEGEVCQDNVELSDVLGVIAVVFSASYSAADYVAPVVFHEVVKLISDHHHISKGNESVFDYEFSELDVLSYSAASGVLKIEYSINVQHDDTNEYLGAYTIHGILTITG